MAEKFKVASKCAICDLNGRVHPSGSVVDGELIGEKGIDDALANGYLIRVNQEEDPSKFPPGTVLNPAVKSDGNMKKIDDSVTITRPIEQVRPKQDTSKFKSRWRFNPADLEGKSLDQLNVLVKENDANVQPFTTTEEAIAFLSRDFSE